MSLDHSCSRTTLLEKMGQEKGVGVQLTERADIKRMFSSLVLLGVSSSMAGVSVTSSPMIQPAGCLSPFVQLMFTFSIGGSHYQNTDK
jgi:hypothetical protein